MSLASEYAFDEAVEDVRGGSEEVGEEGVAFESVLILKAICEQGLGEV